MPNGGTQHLYEGHYCPKCHSRRIHREYKLDGKILDKAEVLPKIQEHWLRLGCGKTAYISYPESLDWDGEHSIKSNNWRCRACGEVFKHPLVIEFYADERYVDRSHFGCPSYRVLMKGKTRKG